MEIFEQRHNSPEREPERITRAAVCLEDGRVLTGHSHVEALNGKHSRNTHEGFSTNRREFVDRREAAQVALGSGQLDWLSLGERARVLERGLESEDLPTPGAERIVDADTPREILL